MRGTEEKKINWYPGHMARAKRLLGEQLKRIELIIELCDARLPYSSRNPELVEIAPGKKRVLFLNKTDLADPEMTEQWIHAFQKEGIKAFEMNCRKTRNHDVMSIIEKSTKDIIQKANEKGMRKTVRAMVVGVPNVGKSTFINRLHGGSIAQTGDRPGVTKSNQWVKISPYLEIMDTPGLLWPRLDDQEAARRLCYIGTIKDEILNIDDLTIELLKDLTKMSPKSIQNRYHLKNNNSEGIELLNEICLGRGWFKKGNTFDYERCCKTILDEFRSGKLGRITLEEPNKCVMKENKSI